VCARVIAALRWREGLEGGEMENNRMSLRGAGEEREVLMEREEIENVAVGLGRVKASRSMKRSWKGLNEECM